MTKSNKTLLCCLLTCVMVLACALTILPIATPTTANAAETTYVKVTGELEDWSGEYLIVYESSNGSYLFDGSLEKSAISSTSNKVEVVISNSTIIGDYSSKTFTFTKVDDSYSIASKSGLYIGRTTDKNGFDANAVSDGTILKNTISFSNGATIIKSSAGPALQFLKSGNASQFKYYKTTQQSIQVYKLQSHTHTWGEWKHVDGTETHTRTCTADATHTETENCTFNESNTCTVCGYTKVICDQTELTLVPEVAATCTTTGVKAHYKCANVACGKLFDKNTDDKQEVTLASLTIAALDHQWNDGEITTAATCTTDGVKTFTCTREGCGETKT